MFENISRSNFGRVSLMRNMVVMLFSALFFSCEDPVGIAVELPSANSLTTFYTDTVSVKRSTIQLDSMVTSGTTFGVVGSYTDPIFGKLTAETYTNVALSPQTTTDYFDLNLGATAVYDSLKLIVSPIAFSYGKDTLKKVNFKVHLLDKLVESRKHNSNEAMSYQATPIASRSINIKDLRKANGADSTIVFKLSDDLGKKLFALSGKISITKSVNGKDVVYGDNTKIADVIKGFAFTIDNGVDVVYSVALSSSALVLYYHTLNDKGEPEVVTSTGTSVKTYPFSLNNLYYSRVVPTYAGTALANLPKTGLMSSQAKGLSFIQNGTGVVTKLQIPFLNQSGGKLAINKAELIIKPLKADYIFPTAIGLVELDDNNQILHVGNLSQFVLLDNTNQAAPIDTSRSYKLNITKYLQGNISKGISRNLALLPYNYYLSSSGSPAFVRNTDIRRIVLDDKSVKLNLYYTKVK